LWASFASIKLLEEYTSRTNGMLLDASISRTFVIFVWFLFIGLISAYTMYLVWISWRLEVIRVRPTISCVSIIPLDQPWSMEKTSILLCCVTCDSAPRLRKLKKKAEMDNKTRRGIG
jgi:hypothetical protein